MTVLVQVEGAVVVVTLALVAVTLTTLILLLKGPIDDRATVIAFTLIGTLVGAYTGAKIGSAGRGEAHRVRKDAIDEQDRAQRARDVAATKVQELAAKLDASFYEDDTKRVKERVRGRQEA